nr:MAG TPA: hypothetical protein [Caudoviricetes sp.]
MYSDGPYNIAITYPFLGRKTVCRVRSRFYAVSLRGFCGGGGRRILASRLAQIFSRFLQILHDIS